MPDEKISDFAPGGSLERCLEGFEARPVQMAMARAVDSLWEEGGALLAEAGTGVGKSLAYLLPGLRRALEGEEGLLIATATLTLQSQLLEKDLPLALKALGKEGPEVREGIVRAMGRSNYFCRLRFESAREQALQSLFEEDGPALAAALDRWAQGGQETLRENLPLPVDAPLWERICVDAYGCLGQQCPHARNCFFLKDRDRLRRAKVVIANHAMVFSDVVARRERSPLLPDLGMVVFDEAHHLERLAGEHLGIRLGHFEVEEALEQLLEAKSGKGLLPRLGFPGDAAKQVATARASAALFFAELSSALKKAEPARALELPRGSIGDPLSEVLLLLAKSLEHYDESLEDEQLSAEIRGQVQRLKGLADTLRTWLEREDPGQVYWLEARGRKSEALLRSAPLKAGEALAEELYPRFRAMLFSSATLATDQGLEYTRKRLGLGEDTKQLVLDSPFDYRHQVELHLKRGMPDPRGDEAAFLESLAGAVRSALELSGGRAFVLFTSFRHLEATATRLKAWVEEEGWLFLKQDGRQAREKILERFRRHGRAVLFGAASFWEGVDVPGEALSCVILCRLPFAVPDTPLEKARAKALEAEGGNAFKDLALPEAVLRLKQGFGRLIRHGQDHGWIHILDPRVLNASYGRAFLKALPRCRLFVDGLEQDVEP